MFYLLGLKLSALGILVYISILAKFVSKNGKYGKRGNGKLKPIHWVFLISGLIIPYLITTLLLYLVLPVVIGFWFVFYSLWIAFVYSLVGVTLLLELRHVVIHKDYYHEYDSAGILIDDDNNSKKHFDRHAWWAISSLIVVILTIFVIGIGIFSAFDKKAVSDNIDVSINKTTKEAPMIKVTEKDSVIPVVNNVNTVLTQLENSVSNIKNANVYDVSHARVQLIDDKLVYVAPLDFTKGFFKYLQYGKTDGYFMVDATNKNAKPKFVKQNMVYTPNAYFNNDAYRVMYKEFANKGYRATSRVPQLELDNKKHPYFVLTLVKYRGITTNLNYHKLGVMTLDAVTGKVKLYDSLKDKPNWLDVAVNPSLASDKLNFWSKWHKGYWNNSWFGAKKDVLNTVDEVGTEGDNEDLLPVLFKGKVYYFATLTSENRKQTSAFGYAYTDASTGKIYYYREKNNAMTPDRAIKLSESLMKQTKWKGSNPTLYRIDGKPTWVVSMLDDSDAFRGYVYLLASGNGVSDTLATGSNATETLESYRNLSGLDTTTNSKKAKAIKVQGTVSRVVISGNEVSFLLNGDPIIYQVNTKSNPYAVFIKEGDTLTFKAKVHNTTADTIDLVNTNLSIK